MNVDIAARHVTNSHTPTRPHAHTQKALIVFARLPVPGRVKTRLTELLTDEEAAALYEAFLRDAFAQYAPLDAATRLYLTDTAKLPQALVPDDVTVLQQQGEGLGARMARAFEETFAAGFECAVIIGTDHPTLLTAHVEAAFAALDTPEAVPIGPTADGGYYLLGMRRLYPSLFAEMTYSHVRVFEETLARIHAAGVRPVVLPRWYDVDTPDDLRQLVDDLKANGEAAPHTRRQLALLVRRYPTLTDP